MQWLLAGGFSPMSPLSRVRTRHSCCKITRALYAGCIVALSLACGRKAATRTEGSSVVGCPELILIEPEADYTCKSEPDQMITRSSDRSEAVEPALWTEAGREKRVAVARFASNWAVSRTVLMLRTGESSIFVYALGDTDHGCYQVRITTEDSSCHFHEDRICFDLDVTWLDGRGTGERWTGAIAWKQ